MRRFVIMIYVISVISFTFFFVQKKKKEKALYKRICKVEEMFLFI